jgi:hypothetical protein
LIEALLVSRIFSTSDRQFREEIREPNSAARYLNLLTGLQLKTLNLEDEAARQKLEQRKAWLEEQIKQGEVKQGTYTFKPKGAP